MPAMRRPVIAGNWKMYKLLNEAVETALALKPLVANANHCDVVVAPVFTALKTVSDRLEGSNVRIAAQNCATQNDFGAHTGEVAPVMLKDVGCTHVIVGHSERRQFYGETDESVNRKAEAALAAGLTAIVCVGEHLSEREAGKAETVVKMQLSSSLNGLTVGDVERIIVAYEPVWAIGTGKTATPEQAQEMHRFIRSVLSETQGADAATSIRILYGGSVKPDNIGQLMAQEDVDGALVGGASLEAENFAKIVNYK
jgi:triosephosphate isomerase